VEPIAYGLGALFVFCAIAYGVAWWQLLDERSRRPGGGPGVLPESVTPRAAGSFMRSTQRALYDSPVDARIAKLQRRVRLWGLFALVSAVALWLVQGRG
jgi:hypothetical protein